MATRRAHSTSQPTDRLVGTSPAMAALRAQIQHLVRFDTPGNPAVPTLLLQGETGTGKGLVARVVHDSGPRAAGPFVEINCEWTLSAAGCSRRRNDSPCSWSSKISIGLIRPR